jgi:hypothetical protein
VVVDLLAQLCWRLVVPIFALEDVLQHGWRAFSPVEGFLKT